jgi:hypothetical protein
VTDSAAEERKPIAEVLQGLEIHPLETGWTAIEALVLMKCLDEEGHATWAYRTTHRLNREELLGALVVHTDVLRRELADEWRDDDGPS